MPFPALAVLASGLAAAQELPSLNDLGPTDSPASIILGDAPSEIQRPTASPDLIVSVLTSLSDAEGLPDDYGVEVSPYWILPHRDVGLDELLGTRWRGKTASEDPLAPLRQIWRNVALSAATYGEADSDDRDVALGARTSLIAAPYASQRCLDASWALSRLAETRAKAIYQRLRELRVEAAKDQDLDDAKIAELAEQAEAEVEAELESEGEAALDACRTLVNARYGAALDLSAAAAWRFPDEDFSQGALLASSVWMTPAYLMRNWSFLTLVRWTHEPDGDVRDRLETGGRVIYAVDDYALSFEGLTGVPLDPGSQDSEGRVAVRLDFLLGKGWWLDTAFGTDLPADEPGSLLTLVNLKFSATQARNLTLPGDLPMPGSDEADDL